jgi:hypothetical protein
MQRVVFLLIAIAMAAGVIVTTGWASKGAEQDAAATFETTLPPDYRDWKLISVAHEAGNLNDFRAVLGNQVAIKAYREGTQPFPDGAMIVRLAWKYISSEENNKAFGREQSFVAGAPINVQLMVKDSAKYASTGGWGFGQFKDGKPDATAQLNACFPCHQPAKANDLVFTHYAPTP